MKLVKKLVILVAAMTMMLSLAACGGEKYPQVYTYTVEWVQGTRGVDCSLTLNEDGTYEYKFHSTDSKDPDKTVMELTATGTYTKDGNIVKIELDEIKGQAMNANTPIDMSNESGYKLTYSQGSTTFELDGETFIPVEE